MRVAALLADVVVVAGDALDLPPSPGVHQDGTLVSEGAAGSP